MKKIINKDGYVSTIKERILLASYPCEASYELQFIAIDSQCIS